MKPSNIIISDITNMKEKFCIAGWDIGELRMKRLLIDRGYWDEANLAKLKGHSWIVIHNEVLKEPRDWPHRTEDVNVDLNTLQIKESYSKGKDIALRVRASVSDNISSIFNNKVKENSYILKSTKCPSLGAIDLPAENVEFVIENGKLRANIIDNDGKKYCLKVSCKHIRDIFEDSKNIETLNKSVLSVGRIHLRIGLARPFLMQENHCYLMLNGLFLY
ncbi:MAG: hypothetical protein FWE52_01240 [Alphaproteobacteria bacterium]|nr:hypothetical protein [Alphaproteobacteria bacterium]